MSGTPLPRAARVLLLLGLAPGLWLAGLFLFIACARMSYPFELEWMEGGLLAQLDRILAGAVLYPAPSADYVPFLYPPLYSYAAVPLALLAGADFLALRLTSLLACLGTAAVLAGLVYHETRRGAAALVAVLLFLATFGITGGWFDLARSDSLAVLLGLGAAALLRIGQGRGSCLLAAGLALAAVWTKQPMVFVAIALGLAALAGDLREHGRAAWRGRRVRWFALPLAGSMVLLCLYLALARPTAWFYLFHVPRQHQTHWAIFLRNFPPRLWQDLPVASLLALVFVVRGGARRPARTFYLLLLGGFFLTMAFPLAKVNGYVNNLIPFYLALALVAGIGVARLPWQRPAVMAVVAAALGFQFLSLRFEAAAHCPPAAMRAHGERLVQRLRELEGPVLLPHVDLARAAGRPASPHLCALTDLPEDDRRAVADQLIARIAAGEYQALVDSRAEQLIRLLGPRTIGAAFRRVDWGLQEDPALRPLTGFLTAGPGQAWIRKEEKRRGE